MSLCCVSVCMGSNRQLNPSISPDLPACASEIACLGVTLCICDAQSESLAAADARIDTLAQEGRLSPALLLTMAKAYAAAKESSYVKEEVKDIMVHLFWKVRFWDNILLPAVL